MKPESPNEGCVYRHTMTGIAKGGGTFKMHEEPESPNEGACFRYMINRETCIRFMMNRNRQRSGRV